MTEASFHSILIYNHVTMVMGLLPFEERDSLLSVIANFLLNLLQSYISIFHAIKLLPNVTHFSVSNRKGLNNQRRYLNHGNIFITSSNVQSGVSFCFEGTFTSIHIDITTQQQPGDLKYSNNSLGNSFGIIKFTGKRCVFQGFFSRVLTP